jgi:hypothetical protein
MEIAQGKKLNDAYLERVEQSKTFAKMDERKAEKHAEKSTNVQPIRRTFEQKAPTDAKAPRATPDAGEAALLTKVFAKKPRRT